MLAQAGCQVAINYLSNESAAEEVVAEIKKAGGEAIALRCDVADRDAVEKMVSEVVDQFRTIDILVNNAGIWKHNPIDSLTDDRLKETIECNLFGTYWPIVHTVPYMKKQKSGVIINISSTAGQRGEAFYSPYAASKGAVIALTKSLAVELAPDNIRVNCVAPGWVVTDMSSDALDSAEAPEILSKIPLGRAGDPTELAGPILFMASDLSSFITGEILNVNGGAVLCG